VAVKSKLKHYDFASKNTSIITTYTFFVCKKFPWNMAENIINDQTYSSNSTFFRLPLLSSEGKNQEQEQN
jgi:hypothetical protein